MEKKKIEKVTKEKRNININVDKIKNAVIIVLSLIIVFGLAFVVPELKNCGKCNETKTVTEVTMSDYRSLLASADISLIYVASPTCGYCAQQLPIMEELVNKYDFEVNYLNTATLSNEEVNELYSIYGAVQESVYEVDGLRTPTMLLVQDGKLIDMKLGGTELSELVSWLQQYTIVEE